MELGPHVEKRKAAAIGLGVSIRYNRARLQILASATGTKGIDDGPACCKVPATCCDGERVSGYGENRKDTHKFPKFNGDPYLPFIAPSRMPWWPLRTFLAL